MSVTTARIGLRFTPSPSCVPPSLSRTGALSTSFSPSTLRRPLSSAALQRSAQRGLSGRPLCTGAASSVLTPSLCRRRHASSSTKASQASDLTASRPRTSNPPASSSVILDWNTFFRLRTSRRRYSLTSSIVGSVATTAAAFVALSEYPDFADAVTKLIPTDPFVSMGIATFGATFLGWLIGPAFGNALWRLLHRSRLPEFTIKERAFFERIKKHRVNPSGASTNNPVPDYYGEKIGSVTGYRRWLKDQRAFNRKRGGNFSSAV